MVIVIEESIFEFVVIENVEIVAEKYVLEKIV